MWKKKELSNRFSVDDGWKDDQKRKKEISLHQKISPRKKEESFLDCRLYTSTT